LYLLCLIVASLYQLLRMGNLAPCKLPSPPGYPLRVQGLCLQSILAIVILATFGAWTRLSTFRALHVSKILSTAINLCVVQTNSLSAPEILSLLQSLIPAARSQGVSSPSRHGAQGSIPMDAPTSDDDFQAAPCVDRPSVDGSDDTSDLSNMMSTSSQRVFPLLTSVDEICLIFLINRSLIHADT
jgi:hypothetical protein